jgi:hypothetical protein
LHEKRNGIGSFQKWELDVMTSTRHSIAKWTAVHEREAVFMDLTSAIMWLFGVRSESRPEMSIDEVIEHLHQILNSLNPNRIVRIRAMDWGKVVNSDDRLDLGGHLWIQIFGKGTGLILASLVYRVNEEIEPSEVPGV